MPDSLGAFRIALDARFAATEELRGIGVYTRELAQWILDQGVPLSLFFDQEPRAGFAFHPSATRVVGGPRGGKLAKAAWEQLWLPRALRSRGVDLWHGTANTGMPLWPLPCRRVLSLHDIIAQRMPGRWGRLDVARRFIKALITQTQVLSAHRVVTVSSFSRREILAATGLPPARLRVVLNGRSLDRDPACDTAASAQEMLARHLLGDERPFFLALGPIEARKNPVRTVRAFAEFCRRALPQPKPVLALAGRFNPGEPETEREVRALLVQPEIADCTRLIGFVRDEDLGVLLRRCRALAYFSLYEGFGLPALEAMHCGAPVLAADNTSIPEVTGDCALYADPYHHENMVSAFTRAWQDETVMARLRRDGPLRAQRFTVAAMGQGVLAIYRELLLGRSSTPARNP